MREGIGRFPSLCCFENTVGNMSLNCAASERKTKTVRTMKKVFPKLLNP